MTDREWDSKLHIDTCGREDHAQDGDHYAYEPTDYCILERLVQSGYIGRDDHLLDYGCGKGRVSFFLNAVTGCRVTGIDYDEDMIAAARRNLKTCRVRGRTQGSAGGRTGETGGGLGKTAAEKQIRFLEQDAMTYEVTDENRFYFFNPFSEKILRVVLDRIVDAWYALPREMYLFFYYPEDEYVGRLMMTPELAFVDEIDCTDLYEHPNRRERILVFELEGGSE